MDDEALLQRARHGDREAFTALVLRYQDRLFTLALRLLGNAEDAADVVQDTFLRAYLHIEELRGAGLRAWLFQVALNCSRDVQRRWARRPSDPLEDADGNIIELFDPAQNPEDHALRRERAAEITAALGQLPLELRTVLVLREINQLSYEEMAEVLRVPLGTVKSRVNRARLQFSRLTQHLQCLPAEGTA